MLRSRLYLISLLVCAGCGESFIDPETGEELPRLEIMVAEADTAYLGDPYGIKPGLWGADVDDFGLRWDISFSDHEECVRISELTGRGVPRYCYHLVGPHFFWDQAGPIRDEPYIITWSVADSTTVPPREDTAEIRVYVLDERP